jgi:hypothetical protein
MNEVTLSTLWHNITLYIDFACLIEGLNVAEITNNRTRVPHLRLRLQQAIVGIFKSKTHLSKSDVRDFFSLWDLSCRVCSEGVHENEECVRLPVDFQVLIDTRAGDSFYDGQEVPAITLEVLKHIAMRVNFTPLVPNLRW